MPKSSTIILILLCMLYICLPTKANLICNGDFENYPLYSKITFDGIYQEYQLFLNDYSCWYASSCGFVEVLKTKYGTGTKATKLITFLICPISMCQTLTLTIGTRYYLSLDVTSMPAVKVATAYAYINDVLVLTVNHLDYNTVTRGYV